MNGIARALQVGQKGKGAEGQEERYDGDDTAGIRDNVKLELKGGIFQENRVEIHQDCKVGQMIARAFRMRFVGANETTAGSGPFAGGGGRVVPEHALNCRYGTK